MHQEAVTRAGLKCSSLSFEGSDYLKKEFLTDIRQYPIDYVKAIASRFCGTIFLPFNYVDMTQSPAEKNMVRQLGSLKIFFKKSTASDSDAEQSAAVSNIRVAILLFYSVVLHLLAWSVSILGIIGFFISMQAGPFRLKDPLILCLCIAVIHRFGLNVAMTAAGTYMISVYLCYLPFVVNSLWQVSRLRFWRSFWHPTRNVDGACLSG